MPTAGLTALHALRDAGGLRSGERVLINGAAGGVGTFAVQVLAQLIDAGKVTPVIDRSYRLDQVPEAIAHVETGHARGKVVVTFE